MSAPNLTIAVEPLEGGKAVFLPLAAASSADPAQIKLVLRLRIKNNESAKVVVDAIQFSFPGSQASPFPMQGVELVLDPDGSVTAATAKGAIEAGQTATWSNGVVKLGDGSTISNAVYLPAPAPPKVAVAVSCKGFTSSATVTLDLAPYTSPTPDGAFLLPFGPADLRAGEYVVMSAQHWANGGAAGGQICAHDIGIQGIDPATNAWSELLPGGSDTKNDDYRIWGKPVRAVADGVVESWKDGVATNTIVKGADGKLKFPSPTPDPGAGNHFWIRHEGDVLVLYAHLQKGTLPAALMASGAKVKAGEKLGLAGNSGNATNPHTHIQCAKGASNGPLRPMPFKNAWGVPRAKLHPPSPDGPWVRYTAHGVPKDAVALWPESTWPTFLVPAAGIARAGNWANTFWVSPDRASFEQKAQELFDQKGRRLVYVGTFAENGARRWVGIARSGDWANSFWISPDRASFEQKAQQLFDQNGRRLVYVGTFVENGARRWIGIARSGDWANSFWISPDRASFEQKAQQLFDQQGRRLVHVATYPEGSARRWIGIARSGDWANSFWISRDLDSFSRQAQDLFDNAGRRLVVTDFFGD